MKKQSTKQVDATPESKLAEIGKEVAVVQKKAAQITIKDAEGVKEATVFLSGIKSRIDKVEELRKFFTQPLVEQKRKIDDLFKQQSTPLVAVFNSVKRALGDYTLEQNRKAREEEERLRKLQEKKNERREAAGKPIDYTPAPVVERAAPTVHTDEGKTTTKMVWKFEIIEPSEVPRQYCSVDEKLVRQAVKDGVREINGVKIYEDVEVAVTAND